VSIFFTRWCLDGGAGGGGVNARSESGGFVYFSKERGTGGWVVEQYDSSFSSVTIFYCFAKEYRHVFGEW